MILILILPLLALSTLSAYGNWISTFNHFSHFQPWLPPLLLGAALLCYRLKNKFLLTWSILLAIYHSTMMIPFFPGQPSEPAPHSIKILQANFNANNSNYQNFIDQIILEEPDLFVVCEGNEHLFNRMTGLHEDYPYRIAAGRWPKTDVLGVSGTFLWSKIPFFSQRSIDLPNAHIKILSVILDYNGNEIQVYAAHLPSPVTSLQIKRGQSGLAEIAQMTTPNAPTILIGDLNNTLHSSCLRKFKKQTMLSSVYERQGYHPTWPSIISPFGISIDHIFTSSHWKTQRIETRKIKGSDHRMLIAYVTFLK